MTKPFQINILLFDEVEVLDFAGPFEVFSLAAHPDGKKCFQVCTVAQERKTLRARGGLLVTPTCTVTDAPPADALIVPGGYGAEEIERYNPVVVAQVRAQYRQANTVIASVCTGAFILAEAGLLDGRSATTHWMDLDRLSSEFPAIQVKRDVKFVDEGRVLTSGGIAAGIHMALHLVSRWAGMDIARSTARRMEYDMPF